MKRRLTIYNTIAFILLGMQIISYLGNATSNEKLPEDQTERIGYYFGSNIFGISAFIFFILANQLRKRIKREGENDKIDSIGKEL